MNTVGQGESILVATDGSPAARAASGFAIQMAKIEQKPIHGLYVVGSRLVLEEYTNHQSELGVLESRRAYGDLVELFKLQGERALNALETACQLASLPVTTEMLFGGIPELILQASATAALLVMGKNGYKTLQRDGRLGDHLRTVVHHAHVPVLIGDGEPRPLKRVLLAYNGHSGAQRALHWTAGWIQAVPVEVLAIEVEDQFHAPLTDRELRGAFARAGLTQYKYIRREGEPVAEILQTAQASQTDLVVMGRYEHNALVEWLTGSTLDGVLRATHLPVLVA